MSLAFLAAEEMPSVLFFWICLMDLGLFIFRVITGLEPIPACIGQEAGKTLYTDYQSITDTHLYYHSHLQTPQVYFFYEAFI